MITLITGPMFSGKTTELLTRVSLCTNKYILIKPSIDDRYSDEEVISHCKTFKHHAHSFPTLKEAFNFIRIHDKITVFIDEYHLFSDHMEAIKRDILSYKWDINISSIDTSSEGRKPLNYYLTFKENINDLHVIYKKAVCEGCGVPASYTYKTGGDPNNKWEVGGSDKYIALCRGCWDNMEE